MPNAIFNHCLVISQRTSTALATAQIAARNIPWEEFVEDARSGLPSIRSRVHVSMNASFCDSLVFDQERALNL